MSRDEGEPTEWRVEILPLGSFPAGLGAELTAAASRRLGAPCQLLAPEVLEAPVVEGRTQVDADAVLRILETRPVDERTVVVGLTAEDIGSPLFTHFFGRARVNGHAAVVSIARLSPTFYGLPDDRAVTARRALLEILHEVGHVAGLLHCDRPSCVMRLTGTVEDLDARGTSWCESCAARLPRGLRPPVIR
jgi:archaemetzincin